MADGLLCHHQRAGLELRLLLGLVGVVGAARRAEEKQRRADRACQPYKSLAESATGVLIITGDLRLNTSAGAEHLLQCGCHGLYAWLSVNFLHYLCSQKLSIYPRNLKELRKDTTFF